MWHLAERKSNMQIKYVHKMGNENKPFTIFSREEIPDDILEIILKNESFRESTTFGEEGLGEPEEIDELIVVFDDGIEKTFKYMNKAIHYFFQGDDSSTCIYSVRIFHGERKRTPNVTLAARLPLAMNLSAVVPGLSCLSGIVLRPLAP